MSDPKSPPVVPIGPPSPVPRGRFAWLADKLADQPVWVQVGAAILLMLVGALTDRTCTRPKPEPTPPPAPVVIEVPAKVPQVEWVIPAPVAAEPVTARQKFVGEHFRRLTSQQLQHDGFALIGGDKTPLSAEAADKLVERLTDRVAYTTVKASRPSFEEGGEGGGILAFIRRVAKWIADHPEQVAAIIKILLTILMAFGDPVAFGVDVLPDGSVLVTAWYDWGSVVCLG